MSWKWNQCLDLWISGWMIERIHQLRDKLGTGLMKKTEKVWTISWNGDLQESVMFGDCADWAEYSSCNPSAFLQMNRICVDFKAVISCGWTNTTSQTRLDTIFAVNKTSSSTVVILCRLDNHQKQYEVQCFAQRFFDRRRSNCQSYD